MIFTSARRAAANLTEPEFRSSFWRSIGLTLLVLIGLWFGLSYLFEWLLLPWVAVMAPDLPGWAEAWADWFGVVAGVAVAPAIRGIGRRRTDHQCAPQPVG